MTESYKEETLAEYEAQRLAKKEALIEETLAKASFLHYHSDGDRQPRIDEVIRYVVRGLADTRSTSELLNEVKRIDDYKGNLRVWWMTFDARSDAHCLIRGLFTAAWNAQCEESVEHHFVRTIDLHGELEHHHNDFYVEGAG